MAEGEKTQALHIQIKGEPPPGPATFVQFVVVDHVGDDVQLTLCDINTTTLRKEVERAREAKDDISLPVEPFQRLLLSKLAVISLAEVLTTIALKFTGESK